MRKAARFTIAIISSTTKVYNVSQVLIVTLDLVKSTVYKIQLLAIAVCISSAVQLQMASIWYLSMNYSFHNVKTDGLGMVRACVDDIVPALIATGMYVVHWHLAEGLSAVKESDSGHVFWRRQLSTSVLYFHSSQFIPVQSSNKVHWAPKLLLGGIRDPYFTWHLIFY